MASAYDYDSDDDILEIATVALLVDCSQVRTKRSCWVRPWIARRGQFGAYSALSAELEAEDTKAFSNFLRMNKSSFTDLLDRVSPLIAKTDTPMRNAIPPGEKLAITLCYLATGDSYKSLKYLYRIPSNTICGFIPHVCQAIYDSLKDDYLKVPTTEQEWADISQGFSDKWQFPHCIGALDGKHIAIRAPTNSGSLYYNYKNFFSIVLLALVDANYKFIYVDIGANGRASDAGIFANSSLYAAMENNTLNVPPPSPLTGRQEPVPHVIVGDDAFPLKTYIMKPFPFRDTTEDKKVFNYRLSRARRVSENAFGILVNRFAVFQRTITVEPENGITIVMASVALHIFLRTKCDNVYTESNSTYISVVRESRATSLVQQGGNRNTANARTVREEFAEYFSTNGQVQWQWDHVI